MGIAQENYHKGLLGVLSQVDTEPVLPERDRESARSDIVGLLRRISRSSAREPQYVIILTDLAHTRYHVFSKLPPPQGDVRVLVLLSPAKPKDAALTLGKPLLGPEQFEIRARQLRESALWITVMPYFAQNLGELLNGKQK